jgi:hypothetical protein
VLRSTPLEIHVRPPARASFIVVYCYLGFYLLLLVGPRVLLSLEESSIASHPMPMPGIMNNSPPRMEEELSPLLL